MAQLQQVLRKGGLHVFLSASGLPRQPGRIRLAPRTGMPAVRYGKTPSAFKTPSPSGPVVAPVEIYPTSARSSKHGS